MHPIIIIYHCLPDIDHGRCKSHRCSSGGHEVRNAGMKPRGILSRLSVTYLPIAGPVATPSLYMIINMMLRYNKYYARIATIRKLQC